MIYKYHQFSLINESKIEYSEKFTDILKLMTNPIAKSILDDTDATYNISRVDIDPVSDTLIKITSDDPTKSNKYRIIDTGEQYPRYSDLFRQLGIRNPQATHRCEKNTIGTLKSSFPHPTNNRELYHFISDDGRDCVIDPSGVERVGRISQLRVGRFVKYLCQLLKLPYSDQQIEVFVNEYKAIWTIAKDGFHMFEIVNGKDIQKYYHESRYESQSGTLGSSCMKGDACRTFFDLYTYNTDVVSMVILKSKVKENSIVGRALLWKLTEPEITFMDRIYTIKDADIELFKKYAISKGWYYKNSQNHSPNEYIVDPEGGKQFITLKTKVSPIYYETYPYLDTLRYYDDDEGILSNDSEYGSDELISTTGSSENRANEED
jgi:hypothetical protein